MPISVVCGTCGKKLKVPDDRAGRMAKCPGCLQTFMVPIGGGSGGPQLGTAVRMSGTTKTKAKQKKEGAATSGVAISWGPIIGIAFVVLIVGGIIAFIMGPMKTKKQWDEIAGQANTDATDVISRGLDLYGFGVPTTPTVVIGGPTHSGQGPELMFFAPYTKFSMPEFVDFKGTHAGGNIKGKYYPATGEVDADVEIGGLSFPGLPEAVHKGTSKINIKGKMVKNEPEVYVNGKKGVMPTFKSRAQLQAERDKELFKYANEPDKSATPATPPRHAHAPRAGAGSGSIVGCG